jgi:uncharacterized protein YlbG (UPF0298 family)
MRNVYYKLLSTLPDKGALYIEHLRTYKRILNLRRPRYYGEKIQWMKLYGNLEEYRDYVDKFEVRKFIAKKIGESYLNELYGVYNLPEEIDFSQLPNKFVLKATHGSKLNLICIDKNKLNIEVAKGEMKKWLKVDFSKLKREPQYSKIKPRIICEKYLDDGTSELRDYKVFCFNGKPKMIEVISNRSTNLTCEQFDCNWVKFDVYQKEYSSTKQSTMKPDCLKEMLEVSQKLSSGIPFVRVDLYIVDNKIIFGELTFTPSGGSEAYLPLERDLEIASWINLEKYLKTE